MVLTGSEKLSEFKSEDILRSNDSWIISKVVQRIRFQQNSISFDIDNLHTADQINYNNWFYFSY